MELENSRSFSPNIIFLVGIFAVIPFAMMVFRTKWFSK